MQNDNNVSVTVNLNIQFADSYRADTYRANYCLRMLGLRPNPPGKFPARDALKAQGYNRLRQVCRCPREAASLKERCVRFVSNGQGFMLVESQP